MSSRIKTDFHFISFKLESCSIINHKMLFETPTKKWFISAIEQYTVLYRQKNVDLFSPNFATIGRMQKINIIRYIKWVNVKYDSMFENILRKIRKIFWATRIESSIYTGILRVGLW